jgi:hypothetical protein
MTRIEQISADEYLSEKIRPIRAIRVADYAV